MIPCKGKKKPVIMIAFKDLFTIQYTCHNVIDFKKKNAILLKYHLEKETDKVFKRQSLYEISIYKTKLIKHQNIYIVRFTIM